MDKLNQIGYYIQVGREWFLTGLEDFPMSDPSFETASRGTTYAIIGASFGGVWLYLGATRAHFASREAALSWLRQEHVRAYEAAQAASLYLAHIAQLADGE